MCTLPQDVCVSRLPGEASATSFSIRHPGALAFEAPEVLCGLSSTQSDVYSFGCVLFCMSTGRQNPLSHDPLDLEDPGLGQGQGPGLGQGRGEGQACVGVHDGAGGVTLQPHAGGATLQPCAGGVTLQPCAGGVTLQPYAGGVTLQPCAGGVTLQPCAGGVTLQPCTGGDTLQPYAGGVTLQWPVATYPPLCQLGEACMSLDPAKRPSFCDLIQVGPGSVKTLKP